LKNGFGLPDFFLPKVTHSGFLALTLLAEPGLGIDRGPGFDERAVNAGARREYFLVLGAKTHRSSSFW
jgi:hypothetical protein